MAGLFARSLFRRFLTVLTSPPWNFVLRMQSDAFSVFFVEFISGDAEGAGNKRKLVEVWEGHSKLPTADNCTTPVYSASRFVQITRSTELLGDL